MIDDHIKDYQIDFFKRGIPTFNFSLSYYYNNEKGKYEKILKNLPKDHQYINIETCKKYWFDSNAYGVCLGSRSNIFVLDIDNKPTNKTRVNGLEFWNSIIPYHPKIDTFTITSISGGKHLYFSITNKTRSFINTTELVINHIKTSIDIKTEGGFIIGPGSYYKENSYKIENNSDIIEMPDWLIELLTQKPRGPKDKSRKNSSLFFKSAEEVHRTEINEIRDILSHINPERFDNYTQWINMAFILHDFGDEYFDLFCEFSETSEKFDLDACQDIWDKYDPNRESRLTKSSLFFYLKQDNPDYYQKLLDRHFEPSIKLISPFCDLTNTGFNKDPTNPRYIQVNLERLYDINLMEMPSANILLIKSFLGTGKSTCIKQFSDYFKTQNKSILILSPRRFFAQSISTTLEIPCYLDLSLDSSSNSKNLVISVESLWKESGKTFDLIILDESESILNQLHSTTMESTGKINAISNLKIFEHLIRNAECIICADAFLSHRTVNLFKNMDSGQVPNLDSDLGSSHDSNRSIPSRGRNLDFTILENTYKPPTKKAIEIPMLKSGKKFVLIPLYKKLLKILKSGKNVIFYFGSKKKLKECELFLQEHFPALKSKYYFGGSSDSKDFKDVNNPDTGWVQYQFIATTTVITVGINFIKKHFNHVFIYGIPGGPLIRDIFQAHYRARIIDGNIYFSINPFHINKQVLSETEMLSRFEHLKLYREMLAFDLKVDISQNKKWLIENYIYTELEKTLGSRYYRSLFFLYLEFCNYTLVEEPNTKTKNISLKEWKEESFSQIENIDSEKAKSISIKINKCEATSHEKRMMIKYTFSKYFTLNNNSNIDSIGNLFDEIHVNGNKKMLSWLNNIKMEKHKHLELTYLKQDLMENIIIDNDLLKLEYISRLCKKLEIENTWNEKEINIENIDGIQLQKDLKIIFGIKNRSKNDGSSRKQIILNLKTILKEWSGSTIERQRNRKRINKVLTEISPIYSLKMNDILKNVEPFIK